MAFEVFRGNLEIVSDCKGVVDEAERIRAGGKASPTSRHADLWARYRDALGAGGVRRVRVRWVPSHEIDGSNRISPSDRAGNDHADRLANAQAKRVGPTASQGKLYDRRTRQLCATQGIQLKILRPSQGAGPAPARAARGPRLEPATMKALEFLFVEGFAQKTRENEQKITQRCFRLRFANYMR